MGEIYVEGSEGNTDGTVVVRASVTFDGSMEECMAWQLAKMSREEVRTFAVKQPMLASVLRLKLERSLEIDGATRAQNVGLIADHMKQYSEEDNALLEEGEKHFADFKEKKAKSLKIRRRSRQGRSRSRRRTAMRGDGRPQQ